jgi:hypothetical protein
MPVAIRSEHRSPSRRNRGRHRPEYAHILLDITPVVTGEVSDDAFVKAAGILKKITIDGIKFQKKMRKEWDGR